MEEHMCIKINKHILNKYLYAKNDKNNKNKKNINDNLYTADLNNNNKEKENKISLKDILNSFSIKITVHKSALIYYIKLYQICSIPFY